MENQELLAAIGAMMDKKLEQALTPIRDELSQIKDGQAQLEDSLAVAQEGLDEVRIGVNTLLEWADTVSVLVKVPLKPAQ